MISDSLVEDVNRCPNSVHSLQAVRGEILYADLMFAGRRQIRPDRYFQQQMKGSAGDLDFIKCR